MITKRDFRTFFLICSLIIASSLAVFGQQMIWSSVRGGSRIETNRSVQRPSFPKKVKLFSLDRGAIEQRLFVAVDKPGVPTVVTLPNAAGGVEQFELFEASNFEPELRAKFPEIRSYSGRGSPTSSRP